MTSDAGMMHRTLSTGVESGSSFRMTKLLLPASAAAVADSGTPGRPRSCADDLLPQVDTSAPPDDAVPRLYLSPNNYSETSWQTSIKFDTSDYQRLPQRYCSVYGNTSGQSPRINFTQDFL